MAATACAPKEWCLTKTETVTYFENWHQNLMYTLSLDAQFVPFSLDGARWLKRTKTAPFKASQLLSSYFQNHHPQELNYYGLHLVSHKPAFQVQGHKSTFPWFFRNPPQARPTTWGSLRKTLWLLQRITSFTATAYNTMERSSLKMKNWLPLWRMLL